jgi:hypothetical protein
LRLARDLPPWLVVRDVGTRLFVFVVAVLVGSAIESLFTWSSSNWDDANPLSDSLVGLFSLGGAVLLASFAQITAREVRVISAVLATAMVVMWWLHAASDRSTASLVFVWGGGPASQPPELWACTQLAAPAAPTPVDSTSQPRAGGSGRDEARLQGADTGWRQAGAAVIVTHAPAGVRTDESERPSVDTKGARAGSPEHGS